MAEEVIRYRATGQPTLADLDAYAAQGVVAVVNVRPASEQTELGFVEAEEVAARGLAYKHIPVSGLGDLTKEKGQQFHDFIATLGDGPVLVHCQGGNRAAGLVAMSAVAADAKQADDAVELAKKIGLRADLADQLKQVLTSQ